jgi:hypothetical protein
MSVSINYIAELPYAKHETLRPVDGHAFVSALIETYGPTATLPALQYLMFTMPNSYSGTADFKQRFEAAVKTGHLCVEDQKYIADMTQRIVSGIFPVS